MFGSILSLFGPLAVRLIGNWLDKRGANEELKREFNSFKAALEKNGFLQSEIRDDVERQREELRRPKP